MGFISETWCKIESVLFGLELFASSRTELEGEGLCFGLTARGISKHLVQQEPEISSLVFLLKSLDSWPQDFFFTSLQINKGSTSTHRDTGNFGDSCTFSVGAFDGGGLILDDTHYVTYQRPLVFDGNIPHSTEIFLGDRIAVVAFTHKSLATTSPLDIAYLTKCGFPVPDMLLIGDALHAW
jgi:hypothetical protein